MFVSTKFIFFHLLFFEFFCSLCECGKIYYHEPIIDNNTGYRNNEEGDSNGEQKGNKNNKQGDDGKKVGDEQRREENDKKGNRGDEQKASSTLPLADSSMRILPYVSNTCYFDSLLQVLFRCELMDKKTFSEGKSLLEEAYDKLRDYLLNDDCKVAIDKEGMRRLFEDIIKDKIQAYHIGETGDPADFFFSFMDGQIFTASMDNILQLQEVKISDIIVKEKEELFKQQKILVFYPRSDYNLKIKLKTKLKECEEISVPGHNMKFKLIATINHIGDTTESGHYVAYVLDQKKNQWKCYNDLNDSAYEVKDINFQEDGSWYIYEKQE